MRVLITSHFPLYACGSGIYVRDVIRRLPRDAIEPAVAGFIVGAGPELGAASYVFHWPAPLPVFTSHVDGGATFAQLDDEGLALYAKCIRDRLAHAIDDFLPDVIHVNHLWLFALEAVRKGLPVVITIHGTELADLAAPRWQGVAAIADAPNAFLLANSRYTAARVGGQDNLRILPFGPPTSTIRAGPVSVESIVLFCGKLTRLKEADVLIRAAARYERQLPNVRTVVCGDGPEEADLRRLAAELRVRSCVFTGTLPHTEILDLMLRSAVYVSPCPVEGLGLAPLEACSQGLPVIAAAGGAHLETISPEEGRLFAPGDDHELARLVVEAITDDWRRKLGENCRRLVRDRFNMERHVEALTSCYMEALDAH